MDSDETINLSRINIVCEYCNRILKKPVLFGCCNTVLCGSHLEDLEIINKKVYKCYKCDKSISDLTWIDLSELLESRLLSKEYLEFKDTFQEFTSNLNKYREYNRERAIDEHFTELRNQADLKRELLKKQIDEYYFQIIEDINLKEKDCKNSKIEVNKEIDEFERQHEYWNKIENDLFHNTDYWVKINDKMKKRISDLKYKMEEYKFESIKNNPFYLNNSRADVKGMLGTLSNTMKPLLCNISDPIEALIGKVNGNKLSLIDINGNYLLRQFSLPEFIGPVNALFMHSNYKILVSDDTALHLFDISRGKFLRSFFRLNSKVKSYVRLNNDEFVILYDSEYLVKWNINNSHFIAEVLVSNKYSTSLIINLNSQNNTLNILKIDKIYKKTTIQSFNMNNFDYLFEHPYSNTISKGKVFASSEDKRVYVSNENQVNELIIDQNKCVERFMFRERTTITQIESLSTDYIVTCLKLGSPVYSIINIWSIDRTTCIKTIHVREGDKPLTRLHRVNDTKLLIMWR